MKPSFNKQSEPIKKYYLRFSDANDIESVKKFYKENRHADVKDRADACIKDRIIEGDVLLIESEDGKIIASSVMYPLNLDPNKINAEWQEIGTVRIILNGYPGLFNALATTQMLRTMLVDAPENHFFTRLNPAVYAFAEGVGWRPFKPSQEILNLSRELKDNPAKTKKSEDEGWYCGNTESLPIVSQKFLHTFDNPVLKHYKFKENGRQILLSFEKVAFAQKFEKELRALATQNLGDVDNPAKKQEMKARQKAWLKKLK